MTDVERLDGLFRLLNTLSNSRFESVVQLTILEITKILGVPIEVPNNAE